MLIGIDGNEANIKNRVGSNEYAFQILWHLYKNQKSPASLCEAGRAKIKNQNYRLKFKIYLKEKPLAGLPEEGTWWEYRILRPRFLWTQWRLPLELYFSKEKPAVFFTPGHYAPRFCPIPLVVSIMDLAFLRYPEQFKKKDLYTLVNWTKRSVKQASHIFTISEFTKKEIMYFYKIPEDKITVTYPGIENSKLKCQNSKPKLKTQILNKYNIKDNYFIYIGTLQPRKNLTRLIEAFAKTLKLLNSKTLQLIICGKKGWLYQDIFRKVKELKLEDKVIFTGFITELEKYILLKNALCFILPSLYEGFGIPVLEAMQLGCPVIISKTSALPEAGGKAVSYIDNPQSIDSIQKAMLKMVKLEDKERKGLINQGYRQIKKFSWQKATKKTLEILHEIANC